LYAQQIHQYLESFFRETDCEILKNQPNFLSVQLTNEIDKKIMNRPFYWQYIEATGGEPNPSQITLITNRNALDEGIWGEVIHFGSPRLNQIFKANHELGSMVKMYENVEDYNLVPWLGMNYKISYQCDRTKEMIFSYGINLVTGTIEDNFHDRLMGVDLVEDMPRTVFCLPIIVKPKRAMERLEESIERIIQQDDHSWAQEARTRWKKEIHVLDYFYEDEKEKPERYEIEVKAIEERYTPRIKMEIVSGGLFYLK